MTDEQAAVMLALALSNSDGTPKAEYFPTWGKDVSLSVWLSMSLDERIIEARNRGSSIVIHPDGGAVDLKTMIWWKAGGGSEQL